MDGSEIRNDGLISAMDAVARDDTPDARRALYEALLGSTVLIPILARPEGVGVGQAAPLEGETSISVLTLHGEDGRIALPIFTDTDTLRVWKPDGSPFVAMALPDLLQVIAENPPDALVVNVAGPTGGEISRAEVLALHEGRMPEFSHRRQLPAGTEVLIGAPSDEVAGPEFEEALREALRAHPAVFAGYLLLIVVGGDEPRLTVGLQLREPLEEPDTRALFDDVAQRLQPLLAGRSLDFVVLEGSMLEQARSIGPVYFA